MSARTWGFKSLLRHQKSPGRRYNSGLGDPTRMTFSGLPSLPIWLTEMTVRTRFMLDTVSPGTWLTVSGRGPGTWATLAPVPG